jgi:predicted CXXCH cytochrome family protein
LKQRFVVWLVLSIFVIVAISGCTQFLRRQPRTDVEEPNPDTAKPQYVGSSACQTCHSDAYQGWSQTLHRLMVQDATRAGVVIADFEKEGNPFEVAQDVTEEDIVYTLGSKWKQRYAIKKGEDFYFLPAQWNVARQEWKPYFADTWNSESRAWRNRCIGCHTTGYNPETNEFTEVGIGCEACHGPGEKHVSSRSRDDIINPARLEAERSTEICGACHFRGKDARGETDYAKGFLPGEAGVKYFTPLVPTPGEETEEFFADGAAKKHHQQYQDYIQSAHYRADVTCADCHESHMAMNEVGELPLKEGSLNDLCISCHRTGGSAFPLETPIDLDVYMPIRATSASEPDIRSHTFKQDQPRPEPKKPYGD